MELKCLICKGSLMISEAEDFADILFGPANRSTKFSDVHYDTPPFVCKKCNAVYFRALQPAKGAKKLEPPLACPICAQGKLQFVQRQDFADVVTLDKDGAAAHIGDIFADDGLWCPNCKWLQIAESGADDSFSRK